MASITSTSTCTSTNWGWWAAPALRLSGRLWRGQSRRRHVALLELACARRAGGTAQDRVSPQHAWAGVAHHHPHLLAQRRLVAVDRTPRARRSCRRRADTAPAVAGVRRAVQHIADTIRTVAARGAPAIDVDHRLYRFHSCASRLRVAPFRAVPGSGRARSDRRALRGRFGDTHFSCGNGSPRT